MPTLTTRTFLGALNSVGRKLRTAKPVPCWTEYLRETRR